MKPDPEKVDKIVNYPVPKNIRELRGILGLFSYYHQFIKDFSKKTDSLYDLLKKETIYSWTSKQQEAFDELKKAITTAPVVRYPDFEKPFFCIPMHLSLVWEQYWHKRKEKKNM